MEPSTDIPSMKTLSLDNKGCSEEGEIDNIPTQLGEASGGNNEQPKTPKRPFPPINPNPKPQERARYAFYHIDIRWGNEVRERCQKDLEGEEAQEERNFLSNYKQRLYKKISRIMQETCMCFDPRCMFNTYGQGMPHFQFFPSGSGNNYELWCKYDSCPGESIPLCLLSELSRSGVMSHTGGLTLPNEELYCHMFLSEMRDATYRLYKCTLSPLPVWNYEERLSRLQTLTSS